MKISNLYEYPTTERMEVDGKRRYVIKGQTKPLPSVTTILSATQSEEKKASLAAWQARVGASEANHIRDTAAARGTVMHHILEGWIKDEPHVDLTPVGQQAEKMAYQIWDNGITDKLNECWGLEVTLYYPGLYAGATDLVGLYENVESIIDFKQSNKPKRREWIEDYKLQLAAYALAHNEIYGTNITKGVNLICTKDNYFQKFEFDGNEFKQAKFEWLRKVDQYYNQVEKK
jgi:genome maintenance exonuclease 1